MKISNILKIKAIISKPSSNGNLKVITKKNNKKIKFKKVKSKKEINSGIFMNNII